MSKILKVIARQVFDSRGNPTIEAEVFTKNNRASSICPSGASTGTFEAFEKRDKNNKKYLGKSVFKVIIVFFQVIFYFVIAGVIKSWVAPFSEDDIWVVVEVVSKKTLNPIRKFLPAAGGLDFSPIFVLIFLNSLNIFLTNLVERITLLVL